MMDDIEKTFLREIYTLAGKDPELDYVRQITITPYPKAYNAGGVVIAVSGTPLRATVLVPLESASSPFLMYCAGPHVLNEYEAATKATYAAVIALLRAKQFIDERGKLTDRIKFVA